MKQQIFTAGELFLLPRSWWRSSTSSSAAEIAKANFGRGEHFEDQLSQGISMLGDRAILAMEDIPRLTHCLKNASPQLAQKSDREIFSELTGRRDEDAVVYFEDRSGEMIPGMVTGFRVSERRLNRPPHALSRYYPAADFLFDELTEAGGNTFHVQRNEQVSYLSARVNSRMVMLEEISEAVLFDLGAESDSLKRVLPSLGKSRRDTLFELAELVNSPIPKEVPSGFIPDHVQVGYYDRMVHFGSWRGILRDDGKLIALYPTEGREFEEYLTRGYFLGADHRSEGVELFRTELSDRELLIHPHAITRVIERLPESPTLSAALSKRFSCADVIEEVAKIAEKAREHTRANSIYQIFRHRETARYWLHRNPRYHDADNALVLVEERGALKTLYEKSGVKSLYRPVES